MTDEELIRKIQKFCDRDVRASAKAEPRFWAGYQEGLDADIADMIFIAKCNRPEEKN